MTSRTVRVALWIALGALAVLRHDLWLWRSDERWLGLPAGLTYHILFCFAVSGLLALLVRYAWPAVDDDSGGSTR